MTHYKKSNLTKTYSFRKLHDDHHPMLHWVEKLPPEADQNSSKDHKNESFNQFNKIK